jgi:serine/threonine-protein phosphatase PP1-1
MKVDDKLESDFKIFSAVPDGDLAVKNNTSKQQRSEYFL